jgi:hypothetical protein
MHDSILGGGWHHGHGHHDRSFTPTAQVMAQVSGMLGHLFAVIPHPISHNSDVVLREKAAAALQQCASILLAR